MPQPYQQILAAFGYPTGDSAVDEEIVKQARLRAGGMPSELDSDNQEFPDGDPLHSDAPGIPGSGTSGQSPFGATPGHSDGSPAADDGDLSLYERWKAQALKNPPRLVLPR